MIEEKIIAEIEARQAISMAKLEAYREVVACIKRMHEVREFNKMMKEI